jgi:hypothetical protein
LNVSGVRSMYDGLSVGIFEPNSPGLLDVRHARK